MNIITPSGSLIEYIQRERKIQSPGHRYPVVNSHSSDAPSSNVSMREPEDQEKLFRSLWTLLKMLEKDTEKTGEEFSFESNLETLMMSLEKSRANSRKSLETKIKAETGKADAGDS